MKYFILMSSFLLFAFVAEAQFARQEQRPEYFIPEKEIARVPSVVVEPQRTQGPSSETITHISAKKASEEKIYTQNVSAHEEQSAEEEVTAVKTEMKLPHFQKKYDEYHKDVLTMKKTKRLPSNQQLKEDLSKMSGDERFEVLD